jgi:hypothetical protein
LDLFYTDKRVMLKIDGNSIRGAITYDQAHFILIQSNS